MYLHIRRSHPPCVGRTLPNHLPSKSPPWVTGRPWREAGLEVKERKERKRIRIDWTRRDGKVAEQGRNVGCLVMRRREWRRKIYTSENERARGIRPMLSEAA